MSRGVAGVDDGAVHLAHRTFDPGAGLLGSEALEPSLGGQLDVDRHAIGVEPGLADQLGIGVGDGLEVDVAAKIMVLAQRAGDLDQLLHRVVRRGDDARGEEQALDIVALVECERELHHLFRREARAADVRALPVDAIMAVEDAAVRQQDLQKRYAAAVRRISVTDAHALSGADPLASGAVALGGPRRGTGSVIFRRIRQDGELLARVEP